VPNSINPLGNKCLMSYHGRYVLEYVIDLAKRAGITEFFISVDHDSTALVEWICCDHGIHYRLAPSAHSFSYVPGLFGQYLTERFLVVCGHQPIPIRHFNAMFLCSNSTDLVATVYKMTSARRNRKRIVLKHDRTKGLYLTSVEEGDIDDNYLSSPYVLDREVLEELRRSTGVLSLSEVIYARSLAGARIGYVTACMPHEFDTIEEWLVTVRSMDDLVRGEQEMRQVP
jgi:NDP-sugar pyrophosphorylase family protein